MSGSFALFSVTYGKDLARFRLQREALEAVGCDFTHRAVVHSEDLDLFRNELGTNGVEWIASGDVLPPHVEQTRQRISQWPDTYRKLRRGLAKRYGWFPDASMDGWHVQQIVKLTLPALAPESVHVCLDSDVLPTARPRLTDFLTEKGLLRLRLLDEPPQLPWVRAAERLLGLPEMQLTIPNHVVWPVALHRDTVRQLHQFLEDRHQKPWWAACLGQRPTQLSEYTLYGAAVERVFDSAHHISEPLGPFTHTIITTADHLEAAARIQRAYASEQTRFLVIQSSRHWPIEPYLPHIRRELAAARSRAQ